MATLTYNGIAFTALYKSSVRSKPVLDEARRTTVYVEHTLNVEGYVHAGGAMTDSTMEGIRKLLTACGGALNYSDKGFGSLVVNGTSAVRDAQWGPVPEILEFTPWAATASRRASTGA